MAFELAKNFQTSTVATAPSPATSGTSLVVAAGEGARFDTPSFNAIIAPADAQPTSANAEIVRVTGISTDTLTITRAQESSSARTVVVGDRIFVGPTAKTWTDIAASDSFLTTSISGRASNALMDAKGDMYAASANDTPARLAVGTNEHVPIYDSAQTVGLRTGIPLGANAAYMPIQDVGQVLIAAGSAQLTNNAISTLSSQITSPTTGGFWGIPLYAADMNLTGRTTKLKVRIVVATNATAPTISFTGGLSVIASAGAANAMSMSWGGPTGNTATVTTPGASSVTAAVSTAFDLPADGLYALVLSTSGAMPATNPKVALWLSLWVAHI